MQRYKIVVSLLAGFSFVSLLLLSLSFAVPLVSVVVMLLLFPGGVAGALLFKPDAVGPPLAMLTVNGLVYSAVFYVALCLIRRGPTPAGIRRVIRWLGVPAVALLGLASIPGLTPIWPHGMSDLKSQEQALRAALPLGTGLDEARRALRANGIDAQEETAESQRVVLARGNETLTSMPGDRVVSARFRTSASVFPCAYDMEIVLLFGNGRLTQRHIGRFRVCP